MDEEIVIGRLRSVPAREVWRHEALDFTPWLLDNADVLSEVIGLDLELDTAEHAVGDFSLDLIGRDRISGDLVIVENQLEQSDHTHLGQIMTYAGGTDAAHIVWVAPSFRPEHRRALEWLNERTDETTRFFAVEVKAVRIGDSPYAPLLSLAVQPNDWGKQVRTKAVQQSGATWSSSDLMPAVRAETTPQVADAIGALLTAHEALGPGAGFYYGTARSPSVTATMSAGAVRAQPWSVFTHLGVVWTLNLDWIHKQGRVLSADFMETLASELGDLPGLAEAFAAGRAVEWRKRPSVAAEPLFSNPGAVDRISAAMARVFQEIRATADAAPPTSMAAFDWSRLHAYKAAIPAGRWTTYGVLAQLVGTAAQPLGQHITRCVECPHAHRVLSEKGVVSAGFTWSDPEDRRDPVQMLIDEGVDMTGGRASFAQRLDATELAALVRTSG
jgi:alkylated DNA nucleotide flippase Atl1